MADMLKSLAAAAAATPASPRRSAGERTFSLCAVDLDGTLLAWRSAAERHTERDTNPGVSRANVEALRRCNEVCVATVAAAATTTTITVLFGMLLTRCHITVAAAFSLPVTAAAAVFSVQEVGMEVVLATGRGPASAARVADRVLNLGCPLVCNNGACVLSRSERRLRQTPETDEEAAPEAAAAAAVKEEEEPAAAWGQRRVLHGSYYPRKFVVGCARLAAAAETMLCIYHPDPAAPSGCAISFCGSVPVSVDDGGINVMVCADEFPDECSPRLNSAQRELVRRSHNALHRLEGDAIATSSAASCCWKLLMWSVGAARDALRSAVENTLHPEAEGIQVRFQIRVLVRMLASVVV
jgi:hypothetical protein